MYKVFFAISFLLSTMFINGQEPIYKKYGVNDGLNNFKYMYLSYTNDTLFVLSDDGEMHYFNGISFYPIESPKSKYIFRQLEFLKKGYFTRNTMNQYYYKRTGGDWILIKTPKSNIVFNNILYGFNADSILYFNEDINDWTFLKITGDKDVTIDSFHPYIYYNDDKMQILTLRNRKNPNLFYNIFEESIFEQNKSTFNYQGSINDEDFFFNESSGNLKWKYANYEEKRISNLISTELKSPFTIKNKFQNNKTASNIFGQENNLYFLTFDPINGINYSGTLNMARANYQKIKEDLYFISSFDGLFKVNPYITYYSPRNSNINKNIRSIVEHKGHIVTGGYGSGFSRLDSNKFSPITAPFLKGNYKNILNGGFALSENEAWFFNEGYSTMFQIKNNILHGYQIYLNGKKSWNKGFYIDTLNDGRLAFSLIHDNFGILDTIIGYNIYINSISDKCGLKHGNTWSFDQDASDRIWLGRFTAGIAVYDYNKETVISYEYDLDNKKTFGVITILIDQFDQMWLGTTKGLFILPNVSQFDIYKNNIFDSAIHIMLPDNSKTIVSSIKKVRDYIIIGNNSGLSFIKNIDYKKSKNFYPIHQLRYGEDVNGTRTELNAMFYDKKRYLYVSTIDAMLKIDMNVIKLDTTKVEIEFKEIKSGNSILNLKENSIIITPDKRNISLKFKPKNNSSFLNNIYYEYSMTNRQRDTIVYQELGQNSNFHLDYINPGNYKFTVHAYKNGLLQDTKLIKIIVPQSLTENTWFWSGLAILLLIIIGSYINIRSRQKRRLIEKELDVKRLENEKDQMKIQAIISSFNPHFINNSLHWVQSRYRKDKVLVQLIENLSDNISDIFLKTKKGKPYHTLNDEIQLINNYINIQKVRFSDSFKFEIINNASLSVLKTNILLLHLQIHIENALEHGIRNRTLSKYVKLEISEDENNIILKIEDDGVGRRISKKFGSKGTQMGTKMIKQLINIFNDKNNEKVIEMYEDEIFTGADGIKYGTRVFIKYPKTYDYNL